VCVRIQRVLFNTQRAARVIKMPLSFVCFERFSLSGAVRVERSSLPPSLSLSLSNLTF
jgi:hypothetical protein